MKNHNIKQILNSVEENSENEQILINNTIKKWHMKMDYSENNILEFSDIEYNEFNEDKGYITSDTEDFQNLVVPNEKAWGTKKKSYFSTDYVDVDYLCISQKNIVGSQFEEEEAQNLQKQIIDHLNEVDFGLNTISNLKCYKNNEYIVQNLCKLDTRQKQELLKKESPELILLVTDFQDRMSEVKKILGPFLNLVKKFNCSECSSIQFIKRKYNLLLLYCTNISFYLMLKAKKESIFVHPVIKRLVQYRQLLTHFEEHQKNILNKIKTLLETNKKKKNLYKSMNNNKIDFVNKKIQKIEMFPKQQKSNKTIQYNLHEPLLRKKSSIDNQQITFGSSSIQNNEKYLINKIDKRAITNEIAKNKGLLPHRKKDQRNPRVKHKNKYRKAKIRRRGAIREIRRETVKYKGELSGIKTSVKKSIKLK